MSQEISNVRVKNLDNDPHDNGGLVRLVCADLLSLREAVQRVHDAEDEYNKACRDRIGTSELVYFCRDIWLEEKKKLREEMASIKKKIN